MHGPVTKLIRKYGTSKNLRDYLLVKPDADTIVGREHQEVVVHLPEGYKKLSECSSKDFKYDMAMKYLDERGIKADLIEEFEIELWDEYYARSLRHHHDPKNIER